jgi:hypothetical protein
MDRYFSKFPTFVYKDKVARDITRRVTITPRDKNNPYNFYPFVLRDELRSDHVAEFYHEDPEKDWLVYHTNNIIDPYYDWHNDTYTFNSLLVNKYGSVENAMKMVFVYRNNWVSDTTQLTPSQYYNQIPQSWKKYYSPIWGEKATIIAFERSKDDYVMNTNRIIQYPITSVNSIDFSIGEIVDFKFGGEIMGGGEVEYCNTSILTVKNVTGNTTANSTMVINIMGETSLANATSDSVSLLMESIPLDEEKFWSPVYYHEFELEKNEERKHINLINNDLVPFIIQDFTEKLQN